MVSNLILLTILVLVLFFGYKLLRTMFMSNRVVLVSSRTKYIREIFLETIEKYVSNPEHTNFIELGAGYAKISALAALNYKWKAVLAVELDPLIVCWTRGINRFKKLPIRYITSDIFDYQIPDTSVVYCYMSVSVMDMLHESGALNGHLVLSLSFPITGAAPLAVYKVQGFQKKLYVYDFR